MEISFTQYLMPDGRPTTVTAEVPDDVGAMAQDQVISCEMLTTGQVAIYSHVKGSLVEDDDEETEIAENGPGPNGNTAKLIELIKRVHENQKLLQGGSMAVQE